MSTYGQQPPYGQPYGQPAPYGQPQQPYGRPDQAPYGTPPPYGGQPNPYAPNAPQQPGPYAPGGQPYGPGYGAPAPQWTPARPQITSRAVIVVTVDSVPGRVVTAVLGDVVGVVARSRELPQALRTGNALDGYATMLTQSRQDAVDAMVQMAEAAGADAVLGVRFDSSEITQSLSEVVAYGTAVTLNPVAEDSGSEAAGEAGPAFGDPTDSPVQPLAPPDFDSPLPPDQPVPPQTSGSTAFNAERSADPDQSWPPPASPQR